MTLHEIFELRTFLSNLINHVFFFCVRAMFKIPPGSVIKLHVLVGFGCYNKMHRLSGLNSRHDFSPFRSLASPGSGYQHGWFWKDPSPWLVYISAFLLYPHTVEKSPTSSSFYKGANPTMRANPITRVLIISQRLQLQILPHWGL